MELAKLNIPPGLRVILTLGDTAASKSFTGGPVLDPVRIQVIDDHGVLSAMEISRETADAGGTQLVQAMLDGRAYPRLVR